MEKLRKIGFSKLTSLDEAILKLESYIKLQSSEEIKLFDGLNRTLSVSIKSTIDIPPFERSAMDGYALKAEDTFGASPNNPKIVKLIGKIDIGETSELELTKGTAIRISTGAPIPNGADAVIKIEDTEAENNNIKLYSPLVPRKNISKKGEDIPNGTNVLKEGIELKAEHIALLSTLGLEKILVRKKPRVSVFATGDELIEIGQPLEPSKIYNSNSPMISNLVKIYGGIVIREQKLKDDKENIKNIILNIEKDSDLIIFTGGTSVGTKDFLPEVIQEIGTTITHGIAMRPGAPLLIGKINECLIFCLPGTPVAAYIGFLTIVGPALRKMMGSLSPDPRIELNAIIEKDVPVSAMGYIHHLRVKISRINNEFIAIPLRLKGSGIISSLTEADGIVEILPHQEGLKKRETVLVKLLPK